jgi:hypothetical protein
VKQNSKEAFMKRFSFVLVTLVCLLALGLSACSSDDSSSSATKFQGTWYNRDPNNPTVNYLFYKFTGNKFVYENWNSGQQYLKISGTFTFTDSTITFINSSGSNDFTDWTSSYTLNGNSLYLQDSGLMGYPVDVIKE